MSHMKVSRTKDTETMFYSFQTFNSLYLFVTTLTAVTYLFKHGNFKNIDITDVIRKKERDQVEGSLGYGICLPSNPKGILGLARNISHIYIILPSAIFGEIGSKYSHHRRLEVLWSIFTVSSCEPSRH